MKNQKIGNNTWIKGFRVSLRGHALPRASEVTAYASMEQINFSSIR